MYLFICLFVFLYLWISADCGSGSECLGMEAPLEAGTAQLMPKLLSDGNVDKVEDDERMITHVDVAQDKHHICKGRGKNAHIYYSSEY